VSRSFFVLTASVVVAVALTGCLLQLENPQVTLEAAPAYNDARISMPFYATGVASPARVLWELACYDTLTGTWEDAGSEQLQIPTDTYGALELGELPESKYRLTVELLEGRSNDNAVAFQRIQHEFYVDRIAPNVSDITALNENPSSSLASEDVYLDITLNDTSNPDFESPHRVLATVGDGILVPNIHEVDEQLLLWTAGEHSVATTITAYLLVIDEAGNRSDLIMPTYTTQ